MSRLSLIISTLFLALIAALPVRAEVEIQEVTSPSGLRPGWSKNIPCLSWRWKSAFAAARRWMHPVSVVPPI